MSVLVAAASVSRGVSSIEPMNTIVVPTLLLLILFSFYWGLSLPFAYIGIKHFFTPNWSKLLILQLCSLYIIMTIYAEGSFGDTKMWLDAITQNAWDTGQPLPSTLTSHAMHTYRSCTRSLLDILNIHDKEKWSCTYWDLDSIVQ